MKKPRPSPMINFRRDHFMDVQALQKRGPVEQENREFDLRVSYQEGEYERAMVAAALREAAGRK